MKNKGLLLLLLFFLSCSKSHRAPLLISAEIKRPGVIERGLAAEGRELCLKDLYTVDALGAEARELEAQDSGEAVTGNWKHLDLSLLPAPQGRFLKIYGEEIGDISPNGGIDWSSCRDLLCVFDRVYGKTRPSTAGLVHYLWYLKMGHMLALDNHVPRQRSTRPGEFNNKPIPLSAYLFSENELYGFWRLTHILGAPHAHLPRMKQIQRVPRGETFEESDYRSRCGLSGSNGWTKLTDGCLSLGDDPDTGYFYTSVVHELSHHVDYELGRRIGATYRSHQTDHLALSGFELQERRESNGNILRSWQKDPSKKSVSTYANSSPQEWFAEVMAYVRVQADIANQRLSREQLNFFANEFYEGREFTQDALFSQWLIEERSWLAERLHMGTMPSDIENELLARMKIKKIEGCQLLKDNRGRDQFRSELRRELASIRSAPAKSREDAVYAYLDCLGEVNERSCFERDPALALYSFSTIKEEVDARYRALVLGRVVSISEKAERLWGSCLEGAHDRDELVRGSFKAREGYVVSSIANCLNARLTDEIRSVVREFSVRHAKEELLLYQITISSFIERLHQLHALALLEEKRQRPATPLFHVNSESY
jgi:hypothetical protein